MENNWKTFLTNKIANEISLQEISDYLKLQKEHGLAKEEVKQFLNELRSVSSAEQLNDSILEVLDIVEGFCSKKFVVW